MPPHFKGVSKDFGEHKHSGLYSNIQKWKDTFPKF